MLSRKFEKRFRIKTYKRFVGFEDWVIPPSHLIYILILLCFMLTNGYITKPSNFPDTRMKLYCIYFGIICLFLSQNEIFRRKITNCIFLAILSNFCGSLLHQTFCTRRRLLCLKATRVTWQAYCFLLCSIPPTFVTFWCRTNM